ncbi:MAG: NAD(P)/FAD-dependent oxidoreductase [Lachnospiraceae bacterium]|nr:NAD(P)/FAD-dependent oxidoreductase [Lachnospiraceae bacterium]
MKKTIAIIGGGVAGLSTGIYAQRAGYETIIYEKNTVLGGSLSGWYRNGYAIDNCVHWLTGTSDGTATNILWKELGVLTEESRIVQRPYLLSSETDGVRVTLWRDPEKTREEMLAISPEDATEINLFIDCVKVATGIVANLSSIPKIAKTVSESETVLSHFEFARRAVLYMGLNIEQWAARFKSEAIRNLLLDFTAKEYESYWLIVVYSFFAGGNADLLEGGSIKIADSLVKTYLEAGGQIKTNMAAKQICIRKRRIPRIERKAKIKTKYAETIIFENGEEVEADYIVCACDIKYVFSKLIKRKKHKSKIIRYIFDHEKEFPMYSAFHVAYSVDGLFEEIDDSLGFDCKPIEVGMQVYDRIIVKNYRMYGDYIAPEGKTVIQCMFLQYEKDFRFWKKLYKANNGRYRQMKKNIADAVLGEILNKYPQYEGKIEVLDTWTPYSYARRNNDTNGAFMRFITTAISRQATIAPEVKGVDNILLASHWLKYPGGLPMAAFTGKAVVDAIEEKEKPLIPFIGEITDKIAGVIDKKAE